jgi:hypothetical protein
MITKFKPNSSNRYYTETEPTTFSSIEELYLVVVDMLPDLDHQRRQMVEYMLSELIQRGGDLNDPWIQTFSTSAGSIAIGDNGEQIQKLIHSSGLISNQFTEHDDAS